MQVVSSNRGLRASQVVLVVENPLANTRDVRDAGSVPGSGRCPGGGQGNSLHCSWWRLPWTEEPGGLPSMLSKSQTRLSDLAHSTHCLPFLYPPPPSTASLV